MNFLQEINWNDLLYSGFTLGMLRLLWDIYKFIKDKATPNEPEVNMEAIFEALLDDSIHVQDLLTEFTEITTLPRVLIIKAESDDDDKILSAQNLNKDTQLTILYETINPAYVEKWEPLKKDFQGHIITQEHKQLLYELLTKTELEIDPKNSDVEIIKQIAEVNNLQSKYMYLVDTIDGIGIVYLVIHNDKKPQEPQRSEIHYKTTILVQRIKELFSRIYHSKKEMMKKFE